MSVIMSLALIAFGSPEVTLGNNLPQDEPAKKEKLICKSLGVTGTRLQKPKSCKTATEWRLIEEAARKRADQFRQFDRSERRAGPI